MLQKLRGLFLFAAFEDSDMTKAVLGVIGGSGIYDLPGLENVQEVRIPSPWGEPSGAR